MPAVRQALLHIQPDQQIADLYRLSRATALVTTMSAGIGISLQWEIGAPPPGGGPGIGLGTTIQTPGDQRLPELVAAQTIQHERLPRLEKALLFLFTEQNLIPNELFMGLVRDLDMDRDYLRSVHRTFHPRA